MNKIILLITSCLIISACQPMIVADEDSVYYRVPLGSTLLLNQQLSIPPNKARIFIQYGQLMSYKAIDKYQPHCEFEINTLKQSIQYIEPDQFEIYRVGTDYRDVSLQFLYASLTMGDEDYGLPIVGFATELYLRSRHQPDVRKLSCLHWDGPKADHLSINQIKKILGDIFTLQLAK